LLLLTGLCPIIGWRKTSLLNFAGKIMIPSMLAVTAAVIFFLAGVRQPYTLIAFTFCTFVAINLFLEFFNGTRTRHAVFEEAYPRALWNLVAKNKRRYGGHVIHFGVVLIFMAFAAGAFNAEKQVTLQPGESFSIKNYSLRYDGIAQYPTANRQRVVATLTLLNDRDPVATLSPEKSLYQGQDQPTTEVAIRSSLKEDLYVILAGYDDKSATFKILVNPMVIWLWIGGIVMALGTVIVMLPQRRRQTEKITSNVTVKLAEAR
jgi:cytochrome c-type biogenesis protein CcmF